jgi:predicted Holliday junction resolvase-like endonuclease
MGPVITDLWGLQLRGLETLVVLLALALAYLLWKYLKIVGKVESRAREIFGEWSKVEADKKARVLFEEWRQREEKRIRESAIKQSEAVIKGKVTEHLIPFFPGFKYNPKDARFIGTPVDLIVFDGLSESNVRGIVFLEVKTGTAGRISPRERLIKKCIDKGNVSYEILHHKGGVDGSPHEQEEP